jgi:hypothetical protein
MTNRLAEIFPKLVFGDHFHVHGLGILPILVDGDIPVIPKLDTLDEALEKGTLTITECGEGGIVQIVNVENRGECGVIILEAEEIVGAKQNRVTSTTVIIAAHSTVKVPCSCVERGRWSYISDQFRSGNSIYRARSRSIQKASVNESLRREGIAVSNQGEVWKETDRCLHEAGVQSSTSSFQDARAHVSHHIEKFVRSIHPVDRQTGALFYRKRGVIGAEFLGNPELFAKCIEKIIRSFAYEVISEPSLNGTSPEIAKDWWAKVLDSSFIEHRSVGLGQTVRAEGDILGSGLRYGEVMIHFSGFPELRQSKERRNGRRLSVRDRRRNLRSSIE